MHLMQLMIDHGLSVVLWHACYTCTNLISVYVMQVFNASAEIEKAANYPNIRIFTAALKSSDTPQTELMAVEQPWSVASPSMYKHIIMCLAWLPKL